jgi:pimeloyl-ACP methyl ester carboxylesterase
MARANSVPRNSISFVGLNDIRLAGDVAGPDDGFPVVLLAGGGQTRHAWGTTFDALAVAGFRAISVDLRGHGESDWDPQSDYRIDAFASDVAAIVEQIGRTPALVGASLGGLASLLALGELGEFGGASIGSSLTLVDVAPRIEKDGRERIGAFMATNMETGFGSLDEVADAIAEYNPHRPRPTDLSGLKKNLRQRADGRWRWHWDPGFVRARQSETSGTPSALIEPKRMEDAARTLTIPTLLVRGRMSDLLSQEGAQSFLDLVPHAEFRDVAGAGHMVAGDRNDLFNDAVVEFLKRHHVSV